MSWEKPRAAAALAVPLHTQVRSPQDPRVWPPLGQGVPPPEILLCLIGQVVWTDP